MKILGIFEKDTKEFYFFFEELAKNNAKAAKLLEKYCKQFTLKSPIPKQIDEIESKNDQYIHQLYHAVDRVFIPPLDREDIVDLAKALDDVTDLLHHSAQTITTYNIQKITPTAVLLSEAITESTKIVSDIIPHLRKKTYFTHIQKAIVEINRLENHADDLIEKGLKDLFHKPKDPIYTLQWRDIYHILADTTDRLEDIGDILRSLVTKYG